MSLLLDEIWQKHTVIAPVEDGETLIYIDRCFVHEESRNAFREGAADTVRFHRKSASVAFVDHYAPTSQTQHYSKTDAAAMIRALQANAANHDLLVFGVDHAERGIMHVVAPEQGLVLPGTTIIGSDSHSCTNGAFGALAFGIGQSEITQIFETQTVWRTKPSSLLIWLEGRLSPGVSAKDLVMFLIGDIGANTAQGRIIEFAGSGLSCLSMEERMTICNMAVEMGALSALMAPDEATIAYLRNRPLSPKNGMFERAAEYWRSLAGLVGSKADALLHIDASVVPPMVSWGTSSEDVLPVNAQVPNPRTISDAMMRDRFNQALAYMDLRPGQSLDGLPIDVAFIGSCTNGRIEDLRAAAAIVCGRRAVIPAYVSPGSRSVKRQAEGEGLRDIFEQAGFIWFDSGCSMCVGSNGDIVDRFKRCVSSSPRNFEGRQGPGARTHIMSPQMVAYAAVLGHIGDVRAAMS